MKPTTWCWFAVATCGVVLIHCGARSSLPGHKGAGQPPGSGGSTPQPDGGVTPPPKPCVLAVAGPATEVMASDDRHVMAPSLVVVDPGDEETARPAQVALQGFASGGSSSLHPDIQLQRLRVAPPWPGGTTIDKPPMLFGVETHGWGQMAHAPGGVGQLALAWYSDPDMVGYTAFRVLDIDSWSAQPPVEIAPNGRPALDLAPGSGVGPGGAGYQGNGYAIAWRELTDADDYNTITALGVLDLEGKLLLGPLWQGVEAPYPGYSPSIVWSSSAYLIATALPDCGPDDDCPPTLTVERLRPASSPTEDDSGLELAWSKISESVLYRPAIDSYGGRTWITWMESDPETSGYSRDVYLQELDAMGAAVGDTQTVDYVIRVESRPTLTATAFGLTIAYAQDGYGTEIEESGYNRIVVHQLDHEGAAMGAPQIIDATLFDDYAPPQAVALEHPRGLLLTWSGRSADSGHEVAYLGFLECTDP